MEPSFVDRTDRRIASNASHPRGGSVALQQADRIHGALQLLLEAREYAADTNRDIWDFAVEGQSLRRIGLTSADLRWLTCKGYVLHACEVTQLGEGRRSFRPCGELTFTKRTCFVLTDPGVEYTRTLLNRNSAENEQSATKTRDVSKSNCAPDANGGTSGSQSNQLVPSWDCDYREIRFNGRVVKQFKLPSPNQEAILMAFSEEGWPPRIDDPLPPHPECDPKQRLHDTIRSLNRNQKNRLLRFKGDGTGQGVLWEPFENGASEDVS